ncbi:MAG: hypothetical protein Q7R34_11480, partial [Dehalococcoidia bacterium]|nr:hypothetical protein [Dehalococcoidia bacterium]
MHLKTTSPNPTCRGGGFDLRGRPFKSGNYEYAQPPLLKGEPKGGFRNPTYSSNTIPKTVKASFLSLTTWISK